MILPVPVKPWVKHLLVKQYGKEPIAFRSNTDIGSILLLSLSDADTLRLTVNDLTEENQPEIEVNNVGEETQIVRFLLSGKFKKAVIIADMLPMIGDALEGYFKIFLKGFSTGYRSLLNSEAASAKSFHQLYEFNEDTLKQDNVIKITQREFKEMNNPFKGQFRPKRNRLQSS